MSTRYTAMPKFSDHLKDDKQRKAWEKEVEKARLELQKKKEEKK